MCIAMCLGISMCMCECQGTYAGGPRVCHTCFELAHCGMDAHITMMQPGAESVQDVTPLLTSILSPGSFADDGPLSMRMASDAML